VSRLLKTLAKIGLVKLDEADRMRWEGAPEDSGAALGSTPEAETGGADTGVRPYEPAPVDPEAAADQDALEGRPLADIYTKAQVPPSFYSAEKLLKLLEGLRTLDPSTRKAAVLAMDAADEDWAVDDAVRDAEHKIRALEQSGAALIDVVKRAEAQAKVDVEAQDRYQHEATSSIRKQIADLEALLAREIEKVAGERAGIQARLQRTKEACGRETKRFREEMARLQEIRGSFGAPAPLSRSHARSQSPDGEK
jgi:BMFP domain-containing protein YqiC